MQYMMDYCPMQTIRSGAKYPACLLTGGLHDPRVQFWEPAKVRTILQRPCHKTARLELSYSPNSSTFIE
jgi:protease II